MSEHDRRTRALALWGSAPSDRQRTEASSDGYGFGSVLSLMLRSWPFISPEIAGVWSDNASAPRASERIGVRTYGWIPMLFTLLFVAACWRGWFASEAGAPVWNGVIWWASAALAVTSWSTLLSRGRARVTCAVLAGGAGALMLTGAWQSSAPAAKLYAFAALSPALLLAVRWFVRVDLTGPRPSFAIRKRTHLIYYYAFTLLNQTITLGTSAFMAVLLYQNVLIGAPLTPAVSSLLGLPAYSQAVVQRLSAEQRMEVLGWYIGFALAIFGVQTVIRMALLYYNAWILQRINQSLRLALLERWHRLSIRYHSDHRVGDSIYRMYQDSAQVTAVIGRVISVLTEFSTFVTAVVALSVLDLRLSLLALALGAPQLLWGRWSSSRIRQRSLVARETASALTSRIQEIVSGVRVIKAYGAESREQDRFEADSVAAFNSAYSARSLVAVVLIGAFTLTAVFLLAAEYQMALWAREEGETFGAAFLMLAGVGFASWNYAAFQWGKTRFFETALNTRALSRDWALTQDMAMGLHRVFDILDLEPEVKDAADALPLPLILSEIRFHDVTFGYAPEQPIVRRVSFSASRGSITAIVGPTGAGKSTLVGLLLRLFDPDRGQITIDGRDLKAFQLESLRANIAIALQENLLFDLSVADNIRYVVPTATDAEVKEAARVACAEEFIEALPQGYQTPLGNRASKLSTGQRQRLSIARAILKNAPILILDEPTAALDAETEHRVLSNLVAWGKDRAIFLITHRLSTIRRADQILYLEHGELRETGRHEELMRAGGRYRNLVDAEELLAAGNSVLAPAAVAVR